VRMSKCTMWAALSLALLCLAAPPKTTAHDDQFLMPEQSAAKAKQILQQAIEALGGSTYLNVHDSTCTGRLGQFDHAGELTGFGHFIDYEVPPDKERQENLPKRNIIEVYNGDKGWDLDRGGVSEAPQVDLADFVEGNKKDIDNILRLRIHEPGMIFRYGGPDIVDLKQVDWVELVDSDNRTIRIAIATATHLPVRKVVDTRDDRTRTKTTRITIRSRASRLPSRSRASATESRFFRSSSTSANTTRISPIRSSRGNPSTNAGPRSARKIKAKIRTKTRKTKPTRTMPTRTRIRTDLRSQGKNSPNFRLPSDTLAARDWLTCRRAGIMAGWE
jgi:hypothetical protein